MPSPSATTSAPGDRHDNDDTAGARDGPVVSPAPATLAELLAAFRDRDHARAALARVAMLLDGQESDGQGFVSLRSVRLAMEGTP